MKNAVIHIVLACASYYLAGRFGLLLAIPPGFASAVWPAAGVALACALSLRLVPATIGVGLGSFWLNLGVLSANLTNFSPSQIGPAACIAMGAVLQTLLAFGLWRFCIGQSDRLDTPSQVVCFLLVVAPIGCLAGASVGASTLLGFNLIQPNILPFTWLTWWVGDAIGTILFAPLLLFYFQGSNTLRRKAAITAPTVITFIGVLFLFVFSMRANDKKISHKIRQDAATIEFKIRERFEVSKNKLRAYSAIFNTVDQISRSQFNSIGEVMTTDDNVLQAIGWTEIVPYQQRKLVEQKMRDEGFSDFEFKELDANKHLIKAKERSVYYPILNLYPLAPNLRALGLDLGSQKDRLAALQLALLTGQPANTAPIVLTQTNTNDLSIIMYLPIFDVNYKRQFHNIDYAKKHIRGFVSGVFDIQRTLDDALNQDSNPGFEIRIVDITDFNNPVPVKKSVNSNPTVQQSVTNQLEFGQRTLEIQFFAPDHLQISTRDWTSWSILTIGLLITAMLQSLLLILTGINERVQREVAEKTEALLNAKYEAEEANKAKSNFLANMSHEFRTPLNAIIGFTNLCIKTNLTEKQQKFLDRVSLASNTLLSLINHTLDYSKIEAQKIELEIKPINIELIFKKIEAIFSLQAEQKNLGFNIILANQHPPWLLGDELRIEQVLLNLCGNALKFTEQGEVKVHSQVIYESREFAKLKISVIDTGIGVSQNQQTNIFLAFQQADNSVSRRYGGTGLGLAIAKQLVELMEGTIALTSEEGNGCIFTIELTLKKPSPDLTQEKILNAPLTNEPNQSQKVNSISPQNQLKAIEKEIINNKNIECSSLPAMAEPQQTPTENNNNSLARKTILLVEDVELNQILARQMLEDSGMHVIVADNGLEALKQLALHCVDAVLMDIQMPIMDGYQATHQIRNFDKFKELPIIALTANVSASDIQSCLHAGMNAHVGKPIEEEVLLATLTKMLIK